MKNYMVQGMVLIRSIIKPDNHTWKDYTRIKIGMFEIPREDLALFLPVGGSTPGTGLPPCRPATQKGRVNRKTKYLYQNNSGNE
ncbi:hypothetical protein EO98_15245 [Methanosarcina sp. 2.H.T.1A.6]|nr:hypothetical protein EO94_06600 [Methanosarcina sp. 2.H.T.1A.3]KKG22862.1 hypothetical protein EO98_15245 [Methanosarcina sp. 2.H.T.1A.6]KKG24408.1 hypothetical protein EO96_14620 [Methanosarcina sp. 2.H.T.1A.8]